MEATASAVSTTRADPVLTTALRTMRVVGTAGHVDHGKSTLIQALTGIDPDRLAGGEGRAA